MSYTIPITKEMVCARSTISVSQDATTKICRKINGMKFEKAKEMVNSLVEGRKSIKGKHYTKAAQEISDLFLAVEANARARNFEPEKMKILISAHKGPTLLRARRKRDFGFRLKSTNVQIVLKKIEEKKAQQKV